MLMADESKKTPKTMPKGGRKGGTQYPRYNLQETLAWAKKLVTKTHLSPQPTDVIFAGVVGAKSGTGNVRISTLKQYGLLEGTSAAYSASDLAKRIVAAPPEEIQPLYRQAALQPKVFRSLFDTFHGDDVTKAKLKQRAADLQVHPEETENCVELYIATVVFAGLATTDGDKVSHAPAGVSTPEGPAEGMELTADAGASDTADEEVPTDQPDLSLRPPRAAINVNVTLDSSLDIDKLAKQLELLKRYGAL
jgi:hypothetical protein